MSGTPRDQSAWVLEEFPDRPNAVRWTYQITDKDYKEAVRQTLERCFYSVRFCSIYIDLSVNKRMMCLFESNVLISATNLR